MSAAGHALLVEDARVGSTLRMLRLRADLRQEDVAAMAGVSRAAVGRAERGRLAELSLETIRRIGAVLDVQIDLVARWQGGDLGRLINARHGAMHEAVAGVFAGLAGWVAEPEVSFSIYGERGVIDILAWHAGRRVLLVVELKTELVDINELMGKMDQKRRLASEIVRDRGWRPANVACWVLVADGRTNRRHVARHGAVLRAKFPTDGRAMRGWLADPSGPLSALSFLPSAPGGAPSDGFATVRRVRADRGARRGSGPTRG